MGVVFFSFLCFCSRGNGVKWTFPPIFHVLLFFCPFSFRADVTTIYSAFRKRKRNTKFVFFLGGGKHMLCPAEKTEGACMFVFPPFSKPNFSVSSGKVPIFLLSKHGKLECVSTIFFQTRNIRRSLG